MWRLVKGAVADVSVSPSAGARRLVGRADDPGDLARWFRGLERQRLVIVGDPGMGKTTLAVLLLLELLRGEPAGEQGGQQPVPVMFSLASFDPRRANLNAWLTRRLEQDHPWLGRDLASALVNRRLVLPVLDGLDEVSERARADVIEAVNAAMSDGALGLVLTCRTAEYWAAVAARDVLRSAAVIEPDVITPRQAATYLKSWIPPSQRAAWRPVLAGLTTRPVNKPLAEALATPLALWLVRHVYLDQGLDPVKLADTCRFPAPELIQQHLAEALVAALIKANPPDPADSMRPARSWDPDKAQRWLGFLACHLSDLGTSDLAWWQLWRAVSPATYGLGIGLAVAVAGGVSAALPAGPTVSPAMAGMVVGLAGGFSGGLGVGLVLARWRRHARPASVTGGARVKDRVVGVLIAGPAAALATAVGAGITVGLAFGLSSGITGGPAAGIRAGLAPALAAGVAVGVTMSFASTRRGMPRPSRGIRLQVTPGGLAAALAVAAGAGLAVGLPYGVRYGLTSAFAGAASIGLAAMLEGARAADTVSPRVLLRQDRQAAMAVALTAGFGVGIVFGLGFQPLTAIGVGVSAGAGFAVVVAMLRAPWLSCALARNWLALHGILPWRLMAFLEDAHRLGILRQVGTVYQFRHIDLQRQLARTSQPLGSQVVSVPGP
jgi:hypothetical protein